MAIDQNSITDLNQFEGTTGAKNNTMEQTYQNYDFGLKGEEILKKKTGSAIESNKCNQCDYASSRAGHMRTHLKTHSGEKPNKCNQCDFASTWAGDLRTHLKMHSGEKPNKCNQCDFASSRAGDLRTHLKLIIISESEKSQLRPPLSQKRCTGRSYKLQRWLFEDSHAHS